MQKATAGFFICSACPHRIMSQCLSYFLLMLAIHVLLPTTGGMTAVNLLSANLQINAPGYLRAADYYLVIQEDCDLVLYYGTQPLKSSGRSTTVSKQGCFPSMQADGNLVLYNGSNPVGKSGGDVRSVWSTRKFS